MLNDDLPPKREKIDRHLIVKAVGFYFILFTVIFGALVLKLYLSGHIDNADVPKALAPSAIEIGLLLASLLVYLIYTRASLISSLKDLYAVGTAVAAAYIANVFFALLGVHAMPTALAAFLIVPIGTRRDAFIGNLFCNFLILATLFTEYAYAAGTAMFPSAYSVVNIVVMAVLGVAGGSFAAFSLTNRTGRLNYVLKGLLIGASTYIAAVFLAGFHGIGQGVLPVASAEFFTLYIRPVLTYGAVCAFLPVTAGLLTQPVIERAFNLVTDTRLVELTDHNAPLIKRLSGEAPGTFSHSLAVASFAEMCASAIGENPYLARAAAYYHDVGKLENPGYYKENQTEVNLHDELLPEVSAEIIRKHTTDGLALCKQYRIPSEVSHVTVQHHGTLLIPVFYEKAKKLTDVAVDPYEYSYHGTTPVTKIAAIIMLCDAAEAAIRAMDAPDGEKIDKLLSGLIEQRIAAGQFNNCDISLKDLTVVKNTIIAAYGGLFHKRLKYPGGEK